jgi:hypothetical protein
MNETFQALLNEAAFTKEILLSGVTQIRKANYAQKGFYFQSFTSLATGLERIGKLCLLLDYYIKNNGQFPDLNYLKNQIRHDLLLLYLKSKDTVQHFKIHFRYLNNLDDSLYQEILSILSNFAKGDRYSNIDFLVTQSKSSDPIAEWHNKIDLRLFNEKISKQKKQTIAANAQIVDSLLRGHASIRHTSETGTTLTDFRSASYLTGVTEAVIPFRQLCISQIIRYWIELLSRLQHLAMRVGRQEIPYFDEIFAPFYNDDNFLKKTKDLTK